jgi:predicted Zn-dependent peptidase
MKGSLALSMEETNSRMIRLGRHELTEVRHLSLDETVAAIEGVTLSEVHEVAQEVFSSPRVLGAVGPFQVSELEAFVR